MTTKIIGDPLESFAEDCVADHYGMWLCESAWFSAAVESVRAGTWRMRSGEEIRASVDAPPYVTDGAGVAYLSVQGHMMKGSSKTGGTSTVRVRRGIRAAAADPNVGGIMVVIDSPGGTVAGTSELAADIVAADKRKPVFAHIEDLGASAAYWIASQARSVSANATAEVGSIGTMAVVEDSSGQAAEEKIAVHVIATGPFKGLFVDGAPVLPEHLDYLRERVFNLNEHFLRAVAEGRGFGLKYAREVGDGRVHSAAKAVELGLVDSVRSLDKAVAALRAEIADGSKPGRTAADARRAVRIRQVTG